MFGELGILMNKPRSATAICSDDTDLAVLESPYYVHILKDVELKRIEDRIAYFTEHFFQEMPRNLIMKYCYNFEKLKLIRGQVIYQQGDLAKNVYLIRKGEIKLIKAYQFGKKERDQRVISQITNSQILIDYQKFSNLTIREAQESIEGEILFVHEGQIFGEIEILQNKLRKYTSVCNSLTGCVWYLSNEIFQRLLKDNKNLKQKFQNASNFKDLWETQQAQNVINTKSKVKQIFNKQLQQRRSLSQQVLIHNPNDPEILELTEESQKKQVNQIKRCVDKKKQILESSGQKYHQNATTQDLLEGIEFCQALGQTLKKQIVLSKKLETKPIQTQNIHQMMKQIKKISTSSQQQEVQENLLDLKMKLIKYMKEKKQHQHQDSLSQSQLIQPDNIHNCKGSATSRYLSLASRPPTTTNTSQITQIYVKNSFSQKKALSTGKYDSARNSNNSARNSNTSLKESSKVSSRCSSALIQSKHNMFRLKPEKFHLFEQMYKL